MTLADLMTSDVSDVLHNTSDFATEVTQWPSGRQAQAATVTAVVLDRTAIRDTERGEEYVHITEIQVGTSVTVTEKDAWVLSGERFDVDRIPKSEFGVQPILLKRHERRHTSGSGGTLL